MGSISAAAVKALRERTDRITDDGLQAGAARGGW